MDATTTRTTAPADLQGVLLDALGTGGREAENVALRRRVQELESATREASNG